MCGLRGIGGMSDPTAFVVSDTRNVSIQQMRIVLSAEVLLWLGLMTLLASAGKS